MASNIRDGRWPESSLPYAKRVNIIATDQPFRWLADGWRDFTVAPKTSMAYGLAFVAIGSVLSYNVWRTDKIYLLAPLGGALVMLTPLLSVGLHAISRAIEQHRRPSFADAFFASQDNVGSMVNAALVFMFMFFLWMQLAQFAFALTLPPAVVLRLHDMGTVFATQAGLEFISLALALGVGLAGLTFMGGAFAMQMLLHRDVGVVEAVATSFTAALMNLRATAVWAAIVISMVVTGVAFFFVGLAVTLPLVGHASWHAYRAMVAR